MRRLFGMTEVYRVIDKSEMCFGRLGYFTGTEHPDGLKVLMFRKKGQPRPTPYMYTCGYYPKQIKLIANLTPVKGEQE